MVGAATLLGGWKIWAIPGSLEWVQKKSGLDDGEFKKLAENAKQTFAGTQKRSSIGSAVVGIVLLIIGVILAAMSGGNENLLIWGAVCGGSSLIFFIFAFLSHNKLKAVSQT